MKSPKNRKSKKKKATKKVHKKTYGIVQSPATGTHLFDLGELEKMVAKFTAAAEASLQSDLLTTIPFFNFLQGKTPEHEVYTIEHTGPLYRVTYGASNPLSIAGSLAYGGRFNVGAAQSASIEPLDGLRPKACIYCSDSPDCSLAEAVVGGMPRTTEIVHLVTSSRPLRLWDITKVVAFLNWPGLQQQIETSLMAARWDLQKVPVMSQVLGSWLRDIGGDGIRFSSTKFPGGFNFAIFAPDERSVAELLSAQDYNEPTQLSLGDLKL